MTQVSPIPSLIPNPRRRSVRRRLIAGAIVLFVGMSLALLVILLARAQPSWWASGAATGPGATEAAEHVENAFITQLTLVRETNPTQPVAAPKDWRSKDWSVSLTQADAAAWLSERFPSWLANREIAWPSNISPPHIAFEDGAVLLGVGITGHDGEEVLWTRLEPQIHDDGSLWVSSSWVRAGNLPLPASWILNTIAPGAGANAENVRRFASILAGERPLLPDAVIPLEDGRKVRLLLLIPRDGRLDITARTEK